MPSTQDLYQFINIAKKNRNYAANTAAGYVAALKLFEKIMSEEERGSLELFKSRFEPIYQALYKKNSADMTTSSLATYRARVVRVIRDYGKYANDPDKMAAWLPRSSSKRENKLKAIKSDVPSEQGNHDSDNGSIGAVHRLDLALRPGSKFSIVVPSDVTAGEISILKTILDQLLVNTKGNEKESNK